MEAVRAIRPVIRGFINSDLADELDFDRIESLATEATTPGLIRSQADFIWKIHFRGSSRFLLLQLEFQSRTDRYMAARMLVLRRRRVPRLARPQDPESPALPPAAFCPRRWP